MAWRPWSPTAGDYRVEAILFTTHLLDPNLHVQTSGLCIVTLITFVVFAYFSIMRFPISPVQTPHSATLQSAITLTTNHSIAASVFLSYTSFTAAESYCQLWLMFPYYNWLFSSFNATLNHCRRESRSLCITSDEVCFQDPGSKCKSFQDFNFENQLSFALMRMSTIV